METDALRLAVSGASGRTGREIARAVAEAPDMTLAGAFGRRSVGRDMAEFAGPSAAGVRVAAPEAFRDGAFDVLVDFTQADASAELVGRALGGGTSCVVGTTGLADGVLDAWRAAAGRGRCAAVVCRNFSLGAMLQARLSAIAAGMFPDLEIVELHGVHKRDRPSGTAAELAAALSSDGRPVPVHSVRLPGLVAHQEVLFGAPGEVLTIRHDVLSREAYAPGVLAAVRAVRGRIGLFSRLEEVVAGPGGTDAAAPTRGAAAREPS